MSTKITYNGKTTELADGYIATLPCKDLKMETDVVVEAPEGSGAAIAEWNGNSAYEPNAIVIFDKVYYVCIKATTAGSVVNNPSVTPSEWKRLNGAYKGEYNSSATYYLGDIVLSNNNLYQSKIDNPETTPDNDMASRWTLLHEGGSGGSLEAPTISITDGILTITDTNASTKSFDIYVDGVFAVNIAKGEDLDLVALELTEGDHSITVKSLVQTGESNSDTFTASANWEAELLGTWTMNATCTGVEPPVNSKMNFKIWLPLKAGDSTWGYTNDIEWGLYPTGGDDAVSLRLHSGPQPNVQYVFYLTSASGGEWFNNVITNNYGVWKFDADYNAQGKLTEEDIKWMVLFLRENFTKDTTTDTQALNIITEGE